MRVVFLGASDLTIVTARLAIERGHEVVIVELDQQKIDVLSEELDCGFINGDGSSPSILEEVGPANTDFLICLTDNDQNNIIASLVGQKMAFDRIITRIDNSDFNTICKQLNLDDVFNADGQAADTLINTIEGHKQARQFTELVGGLYFFKFQVTENMGDTMDALDLPEDTHAVVIFRGEKDHLVSDIELLEDGDIVTLITKKEHVDVLTKNLVLP